MHLKELVVTYYVAKQKLLLLRYREERENNHESCRFFCWLQRLILRGNSDLGGVVVVAPDEGSQS